MNHKQNKTNPLMTVSHIIVVLLLVVMVFQLSSLNMKLDSFEGTSAVVAPQPTAAAPSQPTAPAAPVAIDDARMDALLEGAQVKGDANAPVTIIEYSDFECPFCARFYSDTLGQIESTYIDTGKVKLAYKHFPLSFHPQAQKAGEAFECAGDQNKAWDIHDAIFEKGVGSGVTTFKQYAGELGLDQTEFDACLDEGKYAEKVAGQAQEAQSVGVRGTPGFLINGQLVSGAQPFTVFKQIIDAELAK